MAWLKLNENQLKLHENQLKLHENQLKLHKNQLDFVINFYFFYFVEIKKIKKINLQKVLYTEKSQNFSPFFPVFFFNMIFGGQLSHQPPRLKIQSQPPATKTLVAETLIILLLFWAWWP